MTGARSGMRGLVIRVAPPVVALVFTWGCASPRVPAGTNQTMMEIQHATCDDFARGEVRRLGESVPAAIARGVVIGVAIDLSWALEAVQYGASLPEPVPE